MATVATSASGALAVTATRPASGTTLRAADAWWPVTSALVVADGLGIGVALILAYLLRFQTGLPILEPLPDRTTFYSWVATWALPVWLVVFALYHLYDRHSLFSGFQEYVRVANACSAGTVVVVLISFLDATFVISRGWLLLTWLLSIALVNGLRFLFRRALRALRRQGRLVTPVIIVGANEEGRALAEQFMADPGSGTRVIGFVDTFVPAGTPVLADLTVLGTPDDLPQAVRRWGAKEIVVATTAVERGQLLQLFQTFGHDDAVEVRLSSGLFEILTTGMRVREVSYVPLMTPQRVRITGLDAAVKTVVDFIGAACGLVLLSPVLLAVSVLIRLGSPGPVIYRRRVLGRGGRPFDAFKFRTMIVDAERRRRQVPIAFADRRCTVKAKEDPRITRVGRLLRRTSLDELPQLVNVLRGEMSLVGPRMIAPDEAERYGKWQLNLHTVKPGITGPWQVHGRSDLPYEERVRLSMHYIRNYNLWLDLAILLRTVVVVLGRKGAY